MTTTAKSTAASGNDSPAKETSGSDLLIVDLGKKSKKRVKQIRKGRGKGLKNLQEVVESLRAEGMIGEGETPVCIVVREKPDSKMFSF